MTKLVLVEENVEVSEGGRVKAKLRAEEGGEVDVQLRQNHGSSADLSPTKLFLHELVEEEPTPTRI